MTADKLVFLPEADTLNQMKEIIDLEHIPKQYGGKFDGTFGLLPELDEAYSSRLNWFDGVEKTIPAGR